MLPSPTRAIDTATAVADDMPASPAQLVDEYGQDSFPGSDALSQWAGAFPRSRDGKLRRIVNLPHGAAAARGRARAGVPAARSAGALIGLLEFLCADVMCTPAVRIAAPADPAPLRAAAAA